MSSKKRKQKKQSSSQADKLNTKASSELIIKLLCAASIIVLTLIAYQGASDNEFVSWDDYVYVVDNNLVKAEGTNHNTTIGDVFSSIVSLNYHPLTILSMRMNDNKCATCPQGISPKPFIRWNIILHILNGILVFFFSYQLTRKNVLASLFIALLFALHPMHVESVAWVSERKDVLYGLFFMAGLISYVKYLDSSQNKWLGLSFTLFILSCLSKAMAVVFPLMMFLVYFWYRKPDNNFQALKSSLGIKFFRHSAIFFAVSLLFGSIALSVQGGGDFGGLFQTKSGTKAINEFDTFSIFERIQFASYGYLEYIIKFFVPQDMCTYYEYPDRPDFESSIYFKVAPVLVILINLAAFWSLRFLKGIFVGMGMYIINLILVLQFISVGSVIMADRYSYMSYFGLSFVLTAVIFKWVPKERHKWVFSILCLLAICLIPVTRAQVDTWQNTEVLFSHVIDLHTDDRGAISLRMESPLRIRGNHYGKMAERATSDPERLRYLNEAFDDFKMAADLGSENDDVYEGLGNIYGMRGDYKNSLANYNKALELDPSNTSIYFNRGITYALTGNHIKAIEDFTKVINGKGVNIVRALESRGMSYYNLNRFDEARADFQKVLSINPNDKNAQSYLNRMGG